MSDEREPIRVSISPEPTPEETAAIIAALTVVLAEASSEPDDPMPRTPRWAQAGRREAMRGLDDDPLTGWR